MTPSARTPLLIYTEYKPFQSIFDFLLCPFECSYPLDTYAEWNVAYMRHCECDEYPAITDEYTRILEKEEGENVKVVRLERFDFYEKAKKSRFVLATGEKALYANVIIKKGVVR